MYDCYCIIRHAITDVERKKAQEALDYARKVGDSTGAMISMAQLGVCPTRKPDLRREATKQEQENKVLTMLGSKVDPKKFL